MNIEQIKSEIKYRTSRSGGKGGQNVNKVETKVEAVLDLLQSQAFSETEKATILEKLATRLTTDGVLAVVNQTERSQLVNKMLAEEKLIALLEKSLRPVKPRKSTRVPAGVVRARIEQKQRQSEKKASRRNVDTAKRREEDD